MVDRSNKLPRIDQADELGEGLRQALMRLTSPHYSRLQDEIESLRREFTAIEAHWEELGRVQQQLSHRDQELSRQDQELRALVDQTKASLTNLEAYLKDLNQALAEELRASASQSTEALASLRAELSDPQEVAKRVGPLMVPLVSGSVRREQDEFAEAVAPVIGPAIRRQIRDAKQDIVDALYPLIGEIIGKAIAEAIRELTRKIDASLRRQLRFRSQLSLFFARLRGVSEAELLMRSALPHSIQHVFLIHRKSGLLLQHIPVSDGQVQDTDLISGMLTAIRDFVHDSFGTGSGDLEEIAYGEQRILLEGGSQAYLAVVLEGVEPAGYNQQMREVVAQLHLHQEQALRNFNGDMDRLPDFKDALQALLFPDAQAYELEGKFEPISHSNKIFLITGFFVILALLGLLALGCVYTVRLWPLVFPPA